MYSRTCWIPGQPRGESVVLCARGTLLILGPRHSVTWWLQRWTLRHRAEHCLKNCHSTLVVQGHFPSFPPPTTSACTSGRLGACILVTDWKEWVVLFWKELWTIPPFFPFRQDQKETQNATRIVCFSEVHLWHSNPALLLPQHHLS